MEKLDRKGPGRPEGSALSKSARKERKKLQDQERGKRNKKVLMHVEIHERWMALAKTQGVTARQLASVLLDAVDEGRLVLETRPSTSGRRSKVAASITKVKVPREAVPSTPGSDPETRPGTSGYSQQMVGPGTDVQHEAASSTPGLDPEISTPSTSRGLGLPFTSTPNVPLMPSVMTHFDSSSDARSAESGVEAIGGTPNVSSSEEGPRESDETGDKLDVSVTYKVKGDFVYLDELEIDDDDKDDDYDIEAELSIMQSKCTGLPVLFVGDEVHTISEEQDEADDAGRSFTRSGLHERVEKADVAASARFFLIEENLPRWPHNPILHSEDSEPGSLRRHEGCLFYRALWQ
ncbi:uncharacterized protein [Diadema antillarum]|uniref:uncharacterized protein n=1 Tax=Diadema antillarum TaxID=105358 RepID=UPI003A854BC0